jgi:hypothetical protein
MPAGRPSSYTEEVAEEICNRLAEGQSVYEISRNEWMPHIRTIYRWLEDNEEFRHQYTRAREMQGYTHAGMAVDIARTSHDAGLGRLAYDALKWHAGKLAPKVYGDKTEVIVGSPNGGPAQVERVIIPTNDPIEAARVYQKFMSGDG